MLNSTENGRYLQTISDHALYLIDKNSSRVSFIMKAFQETFCIELSEWMIAHFWTYRGQSQAATENGFLLQARTAHSRP
jgi:predicted NAD/FAD-dependent oxidoreductase